MKTRLIALAISFIFISIAVAQDFTRVYTHPVIPPEKILDRLNLKLAWRNSVPTESTRDGIYSMHLLGDQLIVQKQSGMVIALNAETGVTLWRAAFGVPYRVTQPLGYNSRFVFAISGIRLYAIDRGTGTVIWEYTLPHAAAAPPAADEEHLYLPMSNRRLYVYELPRLAPPPGTKEVAPPPAVFGQPTTAAYTTSEQLLREPIHLMGDFEVGGFLEQPPLITPTVIAVADTRGDIVGFPIGQRNESYRFTSGKPLSAPMAQYGTFAYAASDDFDVFAIDATTGQLQWRLTADRLITHKPAATDEDLYIAPLRGGLYRVDRKTGIEIWRNPDAARFLAHNRLFTYALDRFGGMLVLDRARGTELSCLPVGDFVIPFANEHTDRIYLAANNGLIICLRDREYPKPLQLRAAEKEPPPVPKPAAPAAPGQPATPNSADNGPPR